MWLHYWYWCLLVDSDSNLVLSKFSIEEEQCGKQLGECNKTSEDSLFYSRSPDYYLLHHNFDHHHYFTTTLDSFYSYVHSGEFINNLRLPDDNWSGDGQT